MDFASRWLIFLCTNYCWVLLTTAPSDFTFPSKYWVCLKLWVRANDIFAIHVSRKLTTWSFICQCIWLLKISIQTTCFAFKVNRTTWLQIEQNVKVWAQSPPPPSRRRRHWLSVTALSVVILTDNRHHHPAPSSASASRHTLVRTPAPESCLLSLKPNSHQFSDIGIDHCYQITGTGWGGVPRMSE